VTFRYFYTQQKTEKGCRTQASLFCCGINACRGVSGGTPDPRIHESGRCQHVGIVDILGVNQGGLAHPCFNVVEVEIPKFIPLGQHQQYVTVVHGIIGCRHIINIVKEFFSSFG